MSIKVNSNELKTAIYGKGGIGKSTISSNLTYKLSSLMYKVLHIGCDPKHDSTKFLLEGYSQPTLLQELKREEDSLSMSDVVFSSRCGADCIEAGGPEPGIGCAGRGIITAMATLRKIGMDYSDYDLVLYDVLGDVVCGGFAVPMRKDYAQLIYLVTSGEFMSVYAANNILKGALNHSPDVPRIGGIILNRRGDENEDALVERFSEAVGIPIVCRISRDPLFREAEKKSKTVSEAFPDSRPSKELDVLVRNVIDQMEGRGKRYLSKPLDDSELDQIIKGKRLAEREGSFRLPVKEIARADGEACAARGASSACQNVKDLTIVIHGPRACGYVMNNISDVHFLGNVKNNDILDREYRDNFYCTDMDDSDSIFGGIYKLERLLKELYDDGKRTIAVITACIPGIIGDDVEGCVRRMEDSCPGLKILFIKADGNIAGSVFAGITQVRAGLASLIDETVPPEKGVANLISTVGMNGGNDRKRISELLEVTGFKLNTVLFNGCTVEEIRNSHRAEINIPTSECDSSTDIAGYLRDKGMKVSDRAIPVGYVNTESWLEHVRNDGNSDSVDCFLEDFHRRFSESLERYGSILEGKRIYVISSFGRTVDWAVDVLRAADADVIKASMVGMFEAEPLTEERNSDIPMLSKAGPAEIAADMREMQPDFVLGDDRFIRGMQVPNAPIPKDSIGFEGSIDLLRYMADAVRVSPAEFRRDVL